MNRVIGRNPATIKRTGNLLRMLEKMGLLGHLLIGDVIKAYAARHCYYLTMDGFRAIEQFGFTVPKRIDPMREIYFLTHTLESNELIALAHRLTKARPQVKLEDWKSDLQLKKLDMRVKVGSKDELHNHDSWTYFTTPEEYSFMWEVDRNTEWVIDIKRKITRYLAWHHRALNSDGTVLKESIYRENFDVDDLAVCFVITRGGEYRKRNLLKWTEAAIVSVHGGVCGPSTIISKT